MNTDFSTVLEQICTVLKTRDNFLLLCHRKPDGDTLGSAFALQAALQYLGKKVSVGCSDSLTKKYLFLNDGKETEEYSGTPGYIIAVDIADASHMLGEQYEKYMDTITMVIDHHGTNKRFAKEINAVFPEYAACGEIIYEIVAALDVPVTEQIAAAIYTAISTDTGCFRFSNTTSNTHRIAQILMADGYDFSQINYELFTKKSAARIALEKSLYKTMSFRFDGKVCYAFLTKADETAAGADDADIDGLSDFIRAIDGVWVGILARESESGIRVSMRSNVNINVSEICQSFGGGGHPRAAGCTLSVNAADAEQMLLKEVEKALVHH